ncbi:MAG: excinuclease ABC subunit UvrA [Armatimonadia bacterium]|nr:excinuclease ABC subunit UvrA [Armatimonadia bacterium]
MAATISVRGAREHNLRDLDLELPRDQLIVFTGVSGSGKSSLAFDTLYAEGQRRYVESLSAYARQFLDQMQKPNVDHVEGLSPAIAIEQKTASKNPRSTVGTVTEIYDYMRVLWARVGVQHCHLCGKPISGQTLDQIVDRLMSMPEGTRLQIMAPLVRDRKGEYLDLLEEARAEGFARVRVNGEIVDLADEIKLDKRRKHNIEVVVDRAIVRPKALSRITESMEIALRKGDGLAIIDVVGEGDHLYSQKAACVDCGVSFAKLEPQMFSYNSPQGMCQTCDGLGITLEMDEDLVVPAPELSLREGAVPLLGKPESQRAKCMMEAFETQLGIDVDTPFRDLPEDQRETILHGHPEAIQFVYRAASSGRVWRYKRRYEGILNQTERRFQEAEDESEMDRYQEYLARRPCTDCGGGRLRPESAAVRVGDRTITEVTSLAVSEAQKWFVEYTAGMSDRDRRIADRLIREINERLQFMVDVGLGYLTMDRAAPTLSGGEAQRIRLATQIGSHLVGVLYILDEPSIGLHARDNVKLLNTLRRLRDLGNTVVVVEHDAETILSADHVVDFGPGAGRLGGEVVVSGPIDEVLGCPESLTAAYLSGAKHVRPRESRRKPLRGWLEIKGARQHNLKKIDVRVPVGLFTCVTGVSGSGKSTLVNEILLPGLRRKLHRSVERPGEHDSIEGLEHFDKVIAITQDPIGRTPRSNPASYVGVLTPIREAFAMLPDSKVRGYKPGRFSFNVPGGRCEACKGDGVNKIEMLFLPDVYVTCEQCGGKRFNRETLSVRFKGKSIADVLEMTVDEGVELFENMPRIHRMLKVIQDVGLGYIQLGQSATTLSGGEAQRVKLAKELSKRSTGTTLYVLDEPTTGLHFADVQKLLNVLDRLVEAGNSVVVIEHNLDVIQCADWIVDLGPEGGGAGGQLIASGTPEDVMDTPGSATGIMLRKAMEERMAPSAGRMAAGAK